MIIIDNTGFVTFRGDASLAKNIFGDGTLTKEIYNDDEVLIATETYTLTLEYEDTNEERKLYLADTDWYVTRQAETGKAIPEDILTKRQEARDSIVENN